MFLSNSPTNGSDAGRSSRLIGRGLSAILDMLKALERENLSSLPNGGGASVLGSTTSMLMSIGKPPVRHSTHHELCQWLAWEGVPPRRLGCTLPQAPVLDVRGPP